MTEMTVAAWLVAWVVAKGGHVKDEHVVVVFAMVGQCLQNQSRCCRCMAHHYALAIADVVNGIFGLGYFPFVVFFPVHCLLFVFCHCLVALQTVFCERKGYGSTAGVPDRNQLRHWVAARQTPLDAKALPNHHGQVSWLIASWQKSSQGLPPMTLFQPFSSVITVARQLTVFT